MIEDLGIEFKDFRVIGRNDNYLLLDFSFMKSLALVVFNLGMVMVECWYYLIIMLFYLLIFIIVLIYLLFINVRIYVLYICNMFYVNFFLLVYLEGIIYVKWF